MLVGRDSLDEALDCFRTAVDIRPDYPQAHSNLGLLLAARLDRFAEAAPHLEKSYNFV